MKLKIFSFLIFIFLCLVVGSSSAEPVKTAIPLALDDTKIYLAMEIRQEQINPPVSFSASAPTGLSRPDELLLARYYSLAKSNNVDLLKAVYTSSDGSVDTILRQLAINTDFYGNYTLLEQINIKARKYWGGYHFIDVTLSGGGQSTEWREDILCENDVCKMSVVFDNSTEKEHFLEASLLCTDAFLSQPFDQADLDMKMAALRAQNQSLSIYPDYLPNGLPVYPITIHAHLTRLAEDLFEINPQTSDDPPPVPPVEVQTILNMLKDAAAHAERETIENILFAHWTSMPGGGLCRMTEKESAGEDGTSTAALTSTAYTWEAFHDRVKRWTAIRVLGIARCGDITYVFVEPRISEDKTDTIQLFSVLFLEFDNSYRLITDSDQVVPWYIFRTSIVMQFINEQYQQQ